MMTEEQIHEEVIATMEMMKTAVDMVRETNGRIADPEKRISLTLFIMAKDEQNVKRGVVMLGSQELNTVGIVCGMLQDKRIAKTIRTAFTVSTDRDLIAGFTKWSENDTEL